MLLNNITEQTLDNGLKVIALYKPGASIVATQLWYKTGSINERNGIRGISHMLEHMMFRGSANFESERHSRMINDVGGHCNAFTGEDMTVYTNSVPAEYYEIIFELEADRMDGLTLDSVLFETERKVIIEEYHTYMNNPVAKAFLEFRREFFRNHPYCESPLGTIDDLRKISVEECRDYYENRYRPDNAVLVVVGNIDSGKIIRSARKYFGNKQVKANTDNYKMPEIPNNSAEQSANRMKRVVDFDVPLVIIGYPAPPWSHKDALSLEILQVIMSGGESSRLHKEVVRRRSVAVMVGGLNHFLKYAGMSMFFAAFTPDMPASKVENALEEQIGLVCEKGISEIEMEKVKNSTLTNRTLELYSAENICHHLGFSECIEGDYKLWVERLESLKKIDIERVVDSARTYWNINRRHVLYLKPAKTNPMLLAAGFLRRLSLGRDKR